MLLKVYSKFFIDSLHGRRICRAFWDYYKVTGAIDDSIYLKTINQEASEIGGPGEAEFSMLRLKDIARFVLTSNIIRAKKITLYFVKKKIKNCYQS